MRKANLVPLEDALPIRENTGVPYASQKTFTDEDGNKHPVMHACGHDMHVTSLLGAADLLKQTSSSWSGTLICLLQPNEENGRGAQAMVNDGLFERIPKPDICLAQHCFPLRTGNVAIRPGPCMSAADSFNVTIYGHGGHGSRPESCIDPIVIASYIIVRLQSIVSRVIAPQDAAVVTCGSIHGGSAHNIIPNEVNFKLNIRTYSESVRKKVLQSLHKIIECECEAAGSPRKPDIVRTHEYPLTSNDEEAAATVRKAFEAHFGHERVETMDPCSASEDFAHLAIPNGTPYAFWFLGATDTNQYDEAVRNDTVGQLPGLHTEKFVPSLESTLQTGVQALAVAALTYLMK